MPHAKRPITATLLYGVASLLLSGQEQDWSVKKSAIWWLSHRLRKQEDQEKAQTVLRLVMPPDLITPP